MLLEVAVDMDAEAEAIENSQKAARPDCTRERPAEIR